MVIFKIVFSKFLLRKVIKQSYIYLLRYPRTAFFTLIMFLLLYKVQLAIIFPKYQFSSVSKTEELLLEKLLIPKAFPPFFLIKIALC